MCENIIGFVGVGKRKQKFYAAHNLKSHSAAETTHGLKVDSYREYEWLRNHAAPTVRIPDGDDHDAAWYISDVLTRWPTRADALAYFAAELGLTLNIHGEIVAIKTDALYVDASGCTALAALECPQATYMDASGCTALAALECPQATTVDASGCTALAALECPQATYMDASGCTALAALECPQATTVYASGCTALAAMECPQATTVDASGCTALAALECPQATTVYARGCTADLKINAAPGARIYR